ncbi:hypothetical protein BVJ53_12030 [Lacticaseibacillus chiayiensis]|uniref:Uncharacterized protein n=1 Tax=Lacticaseibacillus chiayiensis TaxID=2100821 RepID=A0A4Q1TKN1_9LACO|nr:hypothetical protein [Lacticaseibacillus chiayiensis]QVI35975.1 hypothetical protein KG086_06720 [Lacticaseibacillus chiayiensis]RXT19054.1 hypothetical protein BVJ53_12030 [Lacticaseibacillus chiayiensis]UYN55274.1 hypothetical protein OFW50_07060 [Lacticaseibacillus chiayiensis]
MSRVMNWVKVPRNTIICWSVFVTLLLPWIFPLLHLSVAIRVGVLFILINMLSAWWIGKMIHRHHLGWCWLLVLPVLFTLMVLWRYKWYGYFFPPIYIVLSLLAMAKD